jgi:hypothetical protein
MDHNKYKEWLLLLMYDELGSDEQEELKAHLNECNECKEEYGKLKKFKNIVSPSLFNPIDDSMLMESRLDLHSAIKTERRRKSPVQKIMEFFERFNSPGYRIAFGGVAVFTIGFFVGYLLFFPKSGSTNEQNTLISERTELVKGEVQISGLKFIDAVASDGEVEFTFDEIIPMHIKGNVNDNKIQKILASALVNEQNPGIRLKAVNAMAAQQTNNPDKETKEALINALKSDENPGVRKEALQVLKKQTFDNEIRDAFLYVLKNDENSGLRIAAINSLAEAKDIKKLSDANMINALKERVQTDDNSYIRMRAKTILMEVK